MSASKSRMSFQFCSVLRRYRFTEFSGAKQHQEFWHNNESSLFIGSDFIQSQYSGQFQENWRLIQKALGSESFGGFNLMTTITDVKMES